MLGNLLASQSLEEGDERGLKPDWTHDYLGPEQFWADGWAYHEEPEASDVAGVLDYTDEWDFLVHDPTVSLNVDELLENPPLVSGEQPPCGLRSISNQKDDFSHLPAEILLDILSFLPTSSVQALRLASRRFGSLYLNSTYWRSRFDYPNELCHIRLPATLLSRQPENSQIDWKTLCDRLLHVPETRNGGWRNRKRIALLTRRLAERVLPKDSDTHVENRIPSKITSSLTCRQFVSCPNRYSFAKASAVFSDLSPPGVIRTISVNFKPFKLASLLVGIEFVGTDDTIRLGSCTPNSTHRTDLQDGEAMKGLIVAMTMVGIVGLEFIIHVKNSPNQTRKCRFGDFEGKVALGKILSDDGSVSGINCESEKVY